MTEHEAIRLIKSQGAVTRNIKTALFEGKSFSEIRNWMEQHGLNRHTAICLESTEIIVVTPQGILLQKRKSDSNQLGMFGGVTMDGETAEEGAVRELKEETGLIVKEEELKKVNIDQHFHRYANGDMAIFDATRFVLELDYVPEIHTDEEVEDGESSGWVIIPPILEHQREFVKDMMNKYYK